MKMPALLIAHIFLIPFYSLSQQPQKFELEAEIKDGIQNGKAFIRYFSPKGPFKDSVVFKKGKIMLNGNVPEKLTVAKLYILQANETSPSAENSCDIWLEAGKIKITANGKLKNAEYDGSTAQKQFSELQKNLLPIKTKGFALDEAYEKAEAEKDAAKKDKLVNEDYPALFNETQQILGAFIRKYPASLVSAYKFEEFAGDGEMNLAIVEPVYELLSGDIKQHPTVVKVADRITINKMTAPGMTALEFSQTDTSGKMVSLSSFQGKYLLVDFWAGWCMPCRAENPNLIKMYSQYSSKGFDILGVSLDGERKRWTNAIVTDKLVWQQVSDLQIFDNTIAKQYGITSIPQNILISPEGKIVAKNLRGTALETKLAEIFK